MEISKDKEQNAREKENKKGVNYVRRSEIVIKSNKRGEKRHMRTWGKITKGKLGKEIKKREQREREKKRRQGEEEKREERERKMIEG